IQGSASWSKWGTAPLHIEGSTTVAVQVNEGMLTGGGAIGSAAVAAGATMTFSGSIGSGVSCAGVAPLSGSSSGTLSVLAGGIVTNSGSYSGPFVTAPGALLVNGGTILNGGNSTVVSNATFLNAGDVNASTLTVGGTFEDTG